MANSRLASLFPEFYAQQQRKKNSDKSVQIGSGIIGKQIKPALDPENKHYFLAEELLVPRVSNSDTTRIQMFASHLNQYVHLINPEYPKVFTNFENQYSEYSPAYKKAKEDFTIIAKIPKNIYNYDLVIQYNKSKIYDVIQMRNYEQLEENFGYHKVDKISDKSEGDIVNKGDYIYAAENYDDNGLFGYGVNLNAVYLAYKGQTYEDACVVTESAAEKLASWRCQTTEVGINGGEVLLNIYGDDEHYKSFPHVGDNTDGNILVAGRRFGNKNILYSFKYSDKTELEPSDNITYIQEGKVVDIDIYCNKSIEELQKNTDSFTQEFLELYEEQNKYYEKCKEISEKILPPATLKEINENYSEEEKKLLKSEKDQYGFNWIRPQPKSLNSNKYTENFGYWWKRVHEYCDNRIKWKSKNGKAFNNIIMKFVTLRKDPLTPGSKLSGRYGNKGVVSRIIPDSETVTAENGIKADIILNPLSIMGRMNPAQLQEQFINFMADHVMMKLRSLKNNINKFFEEYIGFIRELNPKEADFLDNKVKMLGNEAKDKLIEDILNNGIYIHQPPFWDNTSEDKFKEIYKNHPEWVKRYKCTCDNGNTKIEKPLVIGQLYFIRLHHQSSGHASVYNDNAMSNKNIPTKTDMKKKGKAMMLNSPIRLGEQENSNLLLTKNGEALSTLLRSYSTDEEDRKNLVKKLLTSNNPFNINIDIGNSVSINRKLLNKYLEVAELNLIDSNLEDLPGNRLSDNSNNTK